MSYKLKKPITNVQKTDFIVEHKGLIIREGTDTYEQGELILQGDFIFALEPNEMMSEVEAEVDVPDVETIEDEEGNEVEVPVLIDKEIEVDDYDEEGNVIGHHTETIKVQSYHKETVTLYKPVINPNYEEEQAQKEKERIARLSLTKREVFLALYRAKGITPDQIKAQIQDPEALIEFEYATEYYRFNPLINVIGGQLGYTAEDLDYLFINKKLPGQDELQEEGEGDGQDE